MVKTVKLSVVCYQKLCKLAADTPFDFNAPLPTPITPQVNVTANPNMPGGYINPEFMSPGRQWAASQRRKFWDLLDYVPGVNYSDKYYDYRKALLNARQRGVTDPVQFANSAHQRSKLNPAIFNRLNHLRYKDDTDAYNSIIKQQEKLRKSMQQYQSMVNTPRFSTPGATAGAAPTRPDTNAPPVYTPRFTPRYASGHTLTVPSGLG